MVFRSRIGLVSEGPQQLQRALDIYAIAAYADMQLSGGLPPLYEAGIRYERFDPTELWQLPTETLLRRTGDCEDLSAYRVAELRMRGIAARIVFYRAAPGVLHAIVQLPDGQTEDPSRRLGMR